MIIEGERQTFIHPMLDKNRGVYRLFVMLQSPKTDDAFIARMGKLKKLCDACPLNKKSVVTNGTINEAGYFEAAKGGANFDSLYNEARGKSTAACSSDLFGMSMIHIAVDENSEIGPALRKAACRFDHVDMIRASAQAIRNPWRVLIRLRVKMIWKFGVNS